MFSSLIGQNVWRALHTQTSKIEHNNTKPNAQPATERQKAAIAISILKRASCVA
jgi:hypothetical protein